MCFLVCKGLSTDDVGVARGVIFQEIRPGTGFKSGDSVKRKVRGGYSRTTFAISDEPQLLAVNLVQRVL